MKGRPVFLTKKMNKTIPASDETRAIFWVVVGLFTVLDFCPLMLNDSKKPKAWAGQ